jgi:hypothetical protein
MADLVRVGFFNGILEESEEAKSSLRDAVRSSAQDDEERIAGYLDQGTVLVFRPGLAADVLAADEHLIGPAHILTDGVYAWPKVLGFYVRRYHVAVPSDFITHMRSRKWVPPRKDEIPPERLKWTPQGGQPFGGGGGSMM